MTIHLYKTSTMSTRNRTVDSQMKSNPRNNLIYGQHHCGKGRNARGIITARHRGGGHKRLYRKIDFRRNEKDIYVTPPKPSRDILGILQRRRSHTGTHQAKNG